MQVGGGINADNCISYLDEGASHVIVTSVCIWLLSGSIKLNICPLQTFPFSDNKDLNLLMFNANLLNYQHVKGMLSFFFFFFWEIHM